MGGSRFGSPIDGVNEDFYLRAGSVLGEGAVAAPSPRIQITPACRAHSAIFFARVRCGMSAHRIPGRAKWNVAPWSGFAVAQSRPRCPSMIERLMDSPMPNPSGFVV